MNPFERYRDELRTHLENVERLIQDGESFEKRFLLDRYGKELLVKLRAERTFTVGLLETVESIIHKLRQVRETIEEHARSDFRTLSQGTE
jgi:hypothetical protein